MASGTTQGAGKGRLAGRFALITGASHGIGRAVAVRFAAEGASVAINARRESDDTRATLALATAASVEGGHIGAHHLVLPADVGRESEVDAMVAGAIERWGRLDILVNNAGIQMEAPSHTFAVEDLRRVLDTNLIGATLCARAALRHFLQRGGGGTIINCSSVHQIIPKPGYLSYSLSKGAMGNLTRTLALEYADRGIRVNAVAPGAVDTPINAAWTHDPERRAAVESHIPLGRAASAEEIAAVFAFLASDEAYYITGQTIYACGGLTLYNEFKANWSS